MGTIIKNGEVFGSGESSNISFEFDKIKSTNVHGAIVEVFEINEMENKKIEDINNSLGGLRFHVKEDGKVNVSLIEESGD